MDVVPHLGRRSCGCVRAPLRHLARSFESYGAKGLFLAGMALGFVHDPFENMVARAQAKRMYRVHVAVIVGDLDILEEETRGRTGEDLDHGSFGGALYSTSNIGVPLLHTAVLCLQV